MPARKKDLSLGEWNEMVDSFHEESDRGAAILAGSFIEHVLGQYLRSHISDRKVADELFAPLGPLSNFAQRIAIAHAFNLISKDQRKDLEIVLRVRNHFAHHPFDATFGTSEVKQRCGSLSMFNGAKDDRRHTKDGDSHRAAYLVSCGRLCAELLAKSRVSGSKANDSRSRGK